MQPFAIGRCEFPQVQQAFGLIPKEGGVRVHVSLGASSDLGEAILIGTKANMNVRSSARNNIATHWLYWTYQVEVPLERTKLLGSKVFWQDGVGKFSDIKNSEGFPRIGPCYHLVMARICLGLLSLAFQHFV